MYKTEIVLASESTRRRELFKLLTDNFKVMSANIEEVLPEGMGAFSAAEYLAVKKAVAAVEKLECVHSDSNFMVIGCDTTVVYRDIVLGKPKDGEDAKYMLRTLSGNKHCVVTGCCLYLMRGNEKRSMSFSERTDVEFYQLSEREIDGYIETQEPFDKAGAYGIQGKGSLFVKRMEGDYFNVVGLPVAKLKRKIDQMLS